MRDSLQEGTLVEDIELLMECGAHSRVDSLEGETACMTLCHSWQSVCV